jgi:hypothetical protein
LCAKERIFVYKLDSFVGFIGDEQLHAKECYGPPWARWTRLRTCDNWANNSFKVVVVERRLILRNCNTEL